MRTSLIRCVAPMVTSLVAFILLGCKHEAYLTNVPLPTEPPIARDGPETAVGLKVPVNLARARTVVLATLSAPLRTTQRVKSAVCKSSRKRSWCRPAHVTAHLSSPSRVVFSRNDGGDLVARIGFAVTLATGAEQHDASVSRQLQAHVRYRLQLNGLYEAVVTMNDGVRVTPARISIGEGAFDAQAAFSPLFERALRITPEVIARTMNEAGLLRAAARAWRTLHTPLAVADSGGRSYWLRGQPQSVYNLGFVAQDDGLAVHLAFVGPLSVRNGIRPAPLIARDLPAVSHLPPHRQKTDLAQTRLRVPVDVPLASVRAQLAQRLPLGAVIAARHPGSQTRVELEAVNTRIYGASQGLAIEVELGLQRPWRWVPVTARAYLTVQPVLDSASRLVWLRNVALQPRGRFQDAPEHSAVQVELENLRARFAHLDPIRLAPAVDTWLHSNFRDRNADIGSGWRLRARFEPNRIEAVKPTRDGLVAEVLLDGELSFEINRQTIRQAAAKHLPADAAGPAVRRAKIRLR